VKGNTVNMNNPYINIPGSVSKALINIGTGNGTGTGAAIGGDMSAVAKVVKGSDLPAGAK